MKAVLSPRASTYRLTFEIISRSRRPNGSRFSCGA